MSSIVTHLGQNLNWTAYKNGHNRFTITITSGGSAFNISTYVFVLNIRTPGGSTNKLQLTEASGITNGGAAGTLIIDLTQTEASTTLPRDLYFYELTYTKDSKVYPFMQGNLSLSSESNPASTTTSVSVSVSLSGSAVTAAITLAGGDVAQASTTVQGKVELATVTEALTGTDTERAVTPEGLNARTQKVYNVEAYGAVHDYETVSDASITSGTAIVTTVADAFVLADVGKTIRLSGAGAAGADLITTIAGYTSATSITITANASTTISGKKIEWGTDDTESIQDAINAAFDAGGGTVYFPSGIYYIAGNLITSLDTVNPNCQLYIPLSTSSDTQKSIHLLGEVQPNIHLRSFTVTDMTLPVEGVILFSPIVGSGTDPAVLGTSWVPPAGASPEINFTSIYIENIAIKVKSKTGTTDVANIMSAFYLKRFSKARTRNNVAFAESDPNGSAQPTAGYGFHFPQTNEAEGAGGFHEMNMVYAYYTGFRVYEHENLQKQIAVACVNGYEFGCTSTYPGHMNAGQIATHYCKNNILFSADNSVDLSFYSETYTTADKWFQQTADLTFTNTPDVNGQIVLNCIVSGGTLAAVTTTGAYAGNLTIRDNHTLVHTTFGKAATGASRIKVRNESTASNSSVGIQLSNASVTSTFGLLGSGFTTSGNLIANTLYLQSSANTAILLDSQGASGAVKLQVNSTEGLRVTGTGISIANFDKTITAAGTTGAQTINKLAGTVNFAAGASSLVVTNSLVTANSIVLCTIRTNDGTALIKNVVPGSGSFTITLNANTTGETSVGFLVIN